MGEYHCALQYLSLIPAAVMGQILCKSMLSTSTNTGSKKYLKKSIKYFLKYL